MSLDSILNVLVPAGIFIAIGFAIYHKAQEPINKLAGKIKDWLSEKQEEVELNIDDYKLGYRKSDY